MASYPVCSKCSNHENSFINVLYDADADELLVRCLRCGWIWDSPTYERALGLKSSVSLPKVPTQGNA